MKKAIKLTCICIVLCFFFTGCSAESVYDTYALIQGMMSGFQINNSFPDLDGEIDDIRITVVERSDFEIEITNHSKTYDMQALQIYYGYLRDGVWYDFPAENYPLAPLFDKSDEFCRSFESATSDHIVKIGPYLLISIETYNPIIDNDPENEGFVLYDSLGSEFTLMFEEYYTAWTYPSAEVGEQAYCQVADDIDRITGCRVNTMQTSSFLMRFYCILEYDSIPEDYELVSIGNRVTFSEIKSLLARAAQ